MGDSITIERTIVFEKYNQGKIGVTIHFSDSETLENVHKRADGELNILENLERIRFAKAKQVDELTRSLSKYPAGSDMHMNIVKRLEELENPV